MKKTLMVLTFALCATFVFAQTMNPRQKEMKAPTTAKTAVATQAAPSSIFTKDVVLKTIDFSNGTKTGNYWAGTDYQTGIVTSGTDAHGETFDFAYWQRWTTSDADQAAMINMYASLNSAYFGGRMSNYMFSSLLDTNVSTVDNGFMMISLYDQRTQNSGNYNAWIEFGAVDASAAGIVDITFWQSYRRYYDQTFVDYSIDGGTTWVATEINVTGIDLEVNGTIRRVVTYSLPLEAAGKSNLKTRLRAYSPDSERGAYGYFWCVDDVNIIAGPADRFNYYTEEYVEGGYGIVPQGLKLNPAWYSQIKNSGANDQTGVSVELLSGAVNGELTAFASKNLGNLDAGESMNVYCDNGGWLYTDSLEYRGWHGYATHTPNAETGSAALPTATAGDYVMAAHIGNANLDHYYDTMFYKVAGASADLNGGYRWAHDNGLLVYHPYNYVVSGFVQQGGQWYVTDDPDEVDFYAPGYRFTDRYTTDTEVPTDWVIRGVEMVASPVSGYYSEGAQISPVLLSDEYDGGSVGFNSVETGAGVYTVTSDDLNDTTFIYRTTGKGLHQLGDYNTIYIPFPEQPALQANTCYRVGYMIESESYLLMAAEATGYYYEESPSRPDEYDTIYRFSNIPELKQYANFYAPNQYQTYITDPAYKGSFGWYVDVNPMIRLIVGPALDIQRYSISIECEGEEFGQTITNAAEELCGEELTPAEGSTITFYAYPVTGGKVASMTIDGVAVQPYDEATGEGDENVLAYYSEDDEVTYWAVTMANVNANHEVVVTYAEDGVSIDPIASNVRMNLQPNPATSQVSLNIEGVEGMVNCSIIDMSGRVVYNADMNAQNAQVISLNGMAKGAYFVRVTSNNFTKVEKLIVR